MEWKTVGILSLIKCVDDFGKGHAVVCLTLYCSMGKVDLVAPSSGPHSERGGKGEWVFPCLFLISAEIKPLKYFSLTPYSRLRATNLLHREKARTPSHHFIDHLLIDTPGLQGKLSKCTYFTTRGTWLQGAPWSPWPWRAGGHMVYGSSLSLRASYLCWPSWSY